MTDSSIIQDARDALGKWREVPGASPWGVYDDSNVDLGDKGPWGIYVGNGFPPLIVGTAGNPELLDAIDGLLAASEGANPYLTIDSLRRHAERIATAIVAANERMSA